MTSIRSLVAATLVALVPGTSFAIVGGPAPGAVSPQTVKLPSGPGSVRGLADNAQVDTFTGQVQYAVPIPLPAGPGGLTPSLSLGYDGSLGNGPLGVGWQLTQPGIRRSLRLGVPTYDPDVDELELVGLGAGGQVLHAYEIGWFIEKQAKAIQGEEQTGGFRFVDADGRVYLFGTTPEGRKGSGTMTSFWYLERVTDVAGNELVYHYRHAEGEVYLDAIEWGPMVNGARAFRVALEYQPRTDVVVSHRTGFRVASAERLAHLRISSYGLAQRVVTIGYEPTEGENSFPLTRVESITVTGGDGVESLPVTRFTYAAPQAGQVTEALGMDSWGLNLNGVSLFDVDDDGAMDLLRLSSAGHRWRRNLGGQFAPYQTLDGADTASLGGVRLADLDGDSVAELIWQQGSSWKVFALNPAAGGWQAPITLAGTDGLSLSNVTICDLNGDQLMDIVSRAGTNLQVRKGTPAGLADEVTQGAIDDDRDFIYPGSPTTSFPDINGDGLADVVHLGSNVIYLYLGRGDGTFERYGDPRPYPFANPGTAQLRMADLNRDGLLDLAVVQGGNVDWHKGLVGGGFATTPVHLARPMGSDIGVVVAVADANGNGSEDLVWSTDNRMWILDFVGPTTAGMLTRIENGMGQDQEFEYEASTQQMFAAQTPWTRTMPMSIPIAATNRLELASGEPTRSSRLTVRDPIYDREERRFIGFEETRMERKGLSPVETVAKVTRFWNGDPYHRVLRGQPILERVEDGTGKVFQETTYTVNTMVVTGLPAGRPIFRHPIVEASETAHFEGQTTPLLTRVEYGYDTEGRLTDTFSFGRVDLTGDETLRRVTYTKGRSPQGVRDKVCEEQLLDGDEVTVSSTRTEYGDHQVIAGHCQASRGWVRKTEQFLSQENRWIETSATTYTAKGMPEVVTTGGVTRTLAYDAEGFHAEAEEVQPAPGQTLRWELEWNDREQTPSVWRDADGSALVATYDGLGRLRSIAHQGKLPHLYYFYNAAAPRPSVETYSFDGPSGAVPMFPASWSADSRWRHTVSVLNSAGEPLFSATHLDRKLVSGLPQPDTSKANGTTTVPPDEDGGVVDTWIVTGRRQRDAIGRTTAIAETYLMEGSLAQLVASDLPAQTPVRTVAYDALDRPVLQTLPTGAQSTHSYAAFETMATTDGMEPIKTFLDGQGRITRTARRVNGLVEAVEATYDAAGRITEMRLPHAGGLVTHQFTYDSLGRMTFATDPDIGDRTLGYDDAGRLVSHTNGAGQTIAYAYDAAGRLETVTGAGGVQHHYRYDADDVLDPTTFQHTNGRLARVDEPTGQLQLGYDADGRLVRQRRSVHGKTADQLTSYSASGLVLSSGDDDGFSIAVTYDAAGRPIKLGTLWQLIEQDAAGRIMRESFGNGVLQTYERDILGQATRIKIARPGGGSLLYDVEVDHNAYGAITSVIDHDGTGLDHTASFGYDGGGRLTSASVGGYQFGYEYDGLQNMTRRDATGPTGLAILTGQYRYAEGGHGPRQLTSVVPTTGAPTTFVYDDAGRLVQQGALSLSYDGFDKLTQVTGVPGGQVSYAYGHDGLRVSTVDPNGAETVRFTPDITQTSDGTRHIDVRLGDRLIARVTRTPQPALEE